MAKPLEGIRVLDMTVWFQAPVCSQYLADFGAEVIHVERPVSGDPARFTEAAARESSAKPGPPFPSSPCPA